MNRLARILNGFGATILCLQEIQHNAYLPILIDRLSGYPHSAYFNNLYAPKGGLGTFSRLPMTEKSFEPYSDRGLRWLITFFDWALYKGILITWVQLDGLEIVIMNTHLNANYTGNWSRGNPLGRIQYKQVQQLVRLIDRLPSDVLIVLCGDFNFPRSSYLYEELVTNTGLIDPLKDDNRPTYRPFPLISSHWKISLDYLLFRLPPGGKFNVKADILIIEDLNHKNPVNRFLTDHCALKVNFEW